MGYGFCYIAQRCDGGLRISDLTDSLGRIGVRLVNPSNGVVTRLSEVGDQIVTTREEIADLLAGQSSLTVQFWFDAGVDLCGSYRRLPEGVCVHAYSLDGKDPDQRRLLEKWTADYFRMHALRNTALLAVFDSTEVTGKFDWDSFIANGGGLPGAWPELLGLRSSSMPPGSLAPPGYTSESIDGYYLFTRCTEQRRGSPF